MPTVELELHIDFLIAWGVLEVPGEGRGEG
jgi:hypothetical protein